MVELGSLLAARGDLEEAESWHRRAASAGHVDAMEQLGAVLVDRGRTGEAEEWYRKAAGSGRRSALAALALVLTHRGEIGEAEDWWERAATSAGVEVDHDLWSALPPLDSRAVDRRERDAATWGLVVLGLLARRRDDVDRAERCLRRAAGVGNTQAMYELGMLLTRWGSAADRATSRRPGRRIEPSEDQPGTWFTRAAEAGHPDAMVSLSALHRGRPEGDLWWHRAIEARQAEAAEAPHTPD